VTPQQEAEFLRRADALGHDRAALATGETVVSDLLLPSLEHGRFLSMADEAMRAIRRRHFFNPVILARLRIGQGVHDRCEAGAFAGCAVAESDLAGLARHLPFHARALSVRRRVVATDSVWDVSVRGEAWGLDARDDVISVVNVGELVLRPGARLIVQGNLFFLLCQRIVGSDRPEPAGSYHIGILPTPFSVDAREGPLHGAGGGAGRPGTVGAPGRTPPTVPTLLGPRLVGAYLPQLQDGQAGGRGEDGSPGGAGRNGGAAKLAEITLREVVGHVAILAAGGEGGHGGDGADGGAGGTGGAGADGVDARQITIPPGKGGDGGDGGRGGDGGAGGSGGIASNVYVLARTTDQGRIELRPLPAFGGPGGRAGAGGRGGAGGPPGSGGAAGAPGRNGDPGAPGRPGRDRPAPPMFLNEEPHTEEATQDARSPAPARA